MDQKDKQMAFAKIAELEQGGAWRQRQGRRLRKILEKNPQEFWPTYFDAVNQPDPEAAALMRSGTVTERTTFAELPGRACGKSQPGR
jgi:hypothetical protein